MEYGYIRGSTEEIELENQHRLLRERGISVGNIFVDQAVSGVINPNSVKGWSRLNSVLKDGDVVVVTELARIGRQQRFIPDTLHRFHEIGIHLQSLVEKEQSFLKYIGSSDPTEKLIVEFLQKYSVGRQNKKENQLFVALKLDLKRLVPKERKSAAGTSS